MGCCISYGDTVTSSELDGVLKKVSVVRESNLPFQPAPGLFEELRSKLQPHRLVDDPLVSWCQGSAAEIADVVYKGTKVDGLWERCPEHLRGVFWMSGNAVPEVLSALQRGVWFKEERVLIVPIAPLMWAWPVGTPPGAPMHGNGYRLYGGGGDLAAQGFRYGLPSLSFQFHSDDLDYATLRYHPHGDLTRSTEIGIPIGKQIANYLEMDKTESRKGARWTRRIKWRMAGCQTSYFGTYTLKKVLDQDGKPVEPYYSEFLKYMGELPAFVWAGNIAPPVIPLEPEGRL